MPSDTYIAYLAGQLAESDPEIRNAAALSGGLVKAKLVGERLRAEMEKRGEDAPQTRELLRAADTALGPRYPLNGYQVYAVGFGSRAQIVAAASVVVEAAGGCWAGPISRLSALISDHTGGGSGADPRTFQRVMTSDGTRLALYQAGLVFQATGSGRAVLTYANPA